jgi:hypothetical protein
LHSARRVEGFGQFRGPNTGDPARRFLGAAPWEKEKPGIDPGFSFLDKGILPSCAGNAVGNANEKSFGSSSKPLFFIQASFLKEEI